MAKIFDKILFTWDLLAWVKQVSIIIGYFLPLFTHYIYRFPRSSIERYTNVDMMTGSFCYNSYYSFC